MKIEETEWFQKLKQYEHVLIFGAKSSALTTYTWIRQINVELECFLVSKRWDNPFYLEQKPVKTFEEIGKELKENALIVISQIYENNENMKKILLQAGFKNVIPSVTQNTLAMTTELQQYRQSILGPMQISFEAQEKFRQIDRSRVNLCIYAVTSHGNQHKNKHSYQSDYITYIQAGARCTDIRVCELTDASGENISDLNPWYCELTAGYWIYKNDTIHDYVGLYHYSRGLSLSDEQLEAMVRKNVDVILPVPYIWRHEMAAVCFLYIDVILPAISRVSIEYLSSADLFFSEKIFFAGNIVIARREIYVEYYDWMFRVLRECEKIKRESEVQIEPRIWGYYGEVLTTIYFMHNRKKYRILFSNMKDLY